MSDQPKSGSVSKPDFLEEEDFQAAAKSLDPPTHFANLLAGVLVGDQDDTGVEEAILTVRAMHGHEFDRLLPLVHSLAKFVRDHGSELRHVDRVEAMYLFVRHSKSYPQVREALPSSRVIPIANTRVH